MDGWGKIAAGVALGIAGTVYATNRKVREGLPDAARDLPDSVRRRFDSAVNAAKDASASRREEILKDLSRHSAAHPPRPTPMGQTNAFGMETAETETAETETVVGKEAGAGILDEDETSRRVGPYMKHTDTGDPHGSMGETTRERSEQ